jgi:hypothetical protein
LEIPIRKTATKLLKKKDKVNLDYKNGKIKMRIRNAIKEIVIRKYASRIIQETNFLAFPAFPPAKQNLSQERRNKW